MARSYLRNGKPNAGLPMHMVIEILMNMTLMSDDDGRPTLRADALSNAFRDTTPSTWYTEQDHAGENVKKT